MQGQLVAGRYRLADSIGSGGMGRVWRAHDEVLHRAVAIKELTAALYVSESDRERLLARTRAEARAAARINHSAVVTVHDVLEHDGRPWIVMELVEGYSLADAVKERGRVEPVEAARIGLWVLRALRAAHSAGVLHRDVKPGNVLIGHDGRVLLTDFGIAQIEGDTTITRTGEVVGSVDYLAPERVRGHDPGPASDLWALGATLYTAVEGRSPFRRTSPLTTMQAVVEEEAGEPRYAGPLGPVLRALLAKDPADRPDATEAEHMLAEAAEGRRSHSAQAYVPTQHGGPRYETGTGGHHTGHTGHTGTNGFGGTTPRTGSATPYPPVTGPTTIGPTGMGGPGHPSATAPAPKKRRRLRTALLTLVLAAVVGGGAAFAYQQWDQGRDTGGSGSVGPSTSPSPSASSSPTGNANGNVPASWKRYDDPWGFSVYLPEGWSRKVFGVDGDIRQVDYTPDGGDHFVRIAIDTSPDFADAYSHQLNLEGQLTKRISDYHRVRLEKNTYRDRPGGIWEYTWTEGTAADFPGPRRAVEETYMSAEGTEYAIYVSSPADDWATTSKQFKSVLQGWQEKTQQ
ncbi:serine/threonine-protein kinase [Streptomyces cylindrosporus]|uniref:non-specific serine/threonine protein kinase n=1 Tax=Streptomyces cylindrosporus TaxID=2927583 RepID=A0ABS9YHT4_9ACTN|nr:serine/threonine-protein kinase [Streptomyces cylindrosporus]MCI3276100.1 serine/threonine protein kinase [Streptomyces cylindrosporus]